MTGSLFAASQRTVAPFRYDIVGSFLRSDALKEARKRFAQGRITQRELHQVEDAEIAQLVAKQKALGLRAVTDGEYRRNCWTTRGFYIPGSLMDIPLQCHGIWHWNSAWA